MSDTSTATLPPPVRFANYRGDVTHIVGEVKGPNLLGETLTAVSAEYDSAADRTRVGFAFGVHRKAALTGGAK
jgi:hypothetical protein